MARNHDTQQQQQLQDQAPESPDSPTVTPSSPTANTIAPLPPPTLRHRSSASLQGSTSETSSHIPAVTTASPHDYYSHSALLPDENFAPTSWSPQSASSSLPSGSGGENSHAPQSTQGQSQQHDQRQLQQEAAAPGSKRKHPSVSIDPQLHSPNLASPTTGEEQQQQQQQAPKKQRRISKAAKGRGNSIAESEGDKQGEMSSDRPRLSEQEKKNNHIASEQKRRLAIREGFDRLTEIVPGLEGQGRSESIVLKKCWLLPTHTWRMLLTKMLKRWTTCAKSCRRGRC